MRKIAWRFSKASKLSFFFLVLIFFASCQKKTQKIIPAFYHWQTNFQLSDFEKKYLDSLSTSKIYTKFFDVDWESGEVVAKASLNVSPSEGLPPNPLKGESEFSLTSENKANPDSPFRGLGGKNFQIIPTIFITNRTLKNINSNNLNDLANKITTKVFQISNNNNLKINELQLDCDWTLSTKEKYFKLLKLIKKELPKRIQLSATIRLHQIKFSENTGIPPVEKGVLMYYNMGDLENWETKNSILDNEIGKQYLENLEDYPLELDLALPIFRWGVLFRDGRMIRLLNDLRETNLVDSTRFQKIEKSRYQVLQSTYLDGHFLYKNDLIRLEKITPENLTKATEILFPKFDNNFEVIFYHLDENNLHDFSVEVLEQIFTM